MSSFFNKKTGETKLRITIEKAWNLAVADENGLSDPYAILYIDGKKYGKSQVIKKTLNPEWNFHANVSLPVDLIEICVWDKDKLSEMKFRDILRMNKDMLQDDFLGKVTLPYANLFSLVHPQGNILDYHSPENKEVVLTLEKRSVDDNVAGEIQIKFGMIKGSS